MTTYDSLFTDNIAFGKTNISDPTTLNGQRWLNLETSRYVDSVNQFGSFFIVKKFSPEDSLLIENLIIYNQYENGKLRFDKNGNLEITGIIDGVDKVLVAFDNPLTDRYFDNQKYTNENLRAFDNRILIHSENKKWILVLKNRIYYILYNPLHRSSFRDYYAGDVNGSNSVNSGSNNDNTKLFNKYCEINSPKSTFDNNRQYGDKSCLCLNRNECVDLFVGSHVDPNSNEFNIVGSNCVCDNPFCVQIGQPIDNNGNPYNISNDENSFMYHSGETKKSFYGKVTSSKPCPLNNNYTFCKTDINSGGNIQFEGSISQKCGGKTDDDEPVTPPVTPPPVTPPPVTPPPVTPPPATPLNPFLIAFIVIISLYALFGVYILYAKMKLRGQSNF